MTRFALAALAWALAGCAGSNWREPTGPPGPLIAGDQRAKILVSCDDRPMGLSDVKHCISAFEDHTGRKLDAMQEVLHRIEDYAENVPQLTGWLRHYGGGVLGSARNRGLFPYKLHLLTISPSVVMVVPHDRAVDGPSVCAGLWEQSCFYSQRLSSAMITWGEAPKVRPGSFWFSPELRVAGRAVPEDAARFTIPTGDVALDLAAEGGAWRAKRPR